MSINILKKKLKKKIHKNEKCENIIRILEIEI